MYTRFRRFRGGWCPSWNRRPGYRTELSKNVEAIGRQAASTPTFPKNSECLFLFKVLFRCYSSPNLTITFSTTLQQMYDCLNVTIDFYDGAVSITMEVKNAVRKIDGIELRVSVSQGNAPEQTVTARLCGFTLDWPTKKLTRTNQDMVVSRLDHLQWVPLDI